MYIEGQKEIGVNGASCEQIGARGTKVRYCEGLDLTMRRNTSSSETREGGWVGVTHWKSRMVGAIQCSVQDEHRKEVLMRAFCRS